ncbi:MAG: glycosyltransferase, partial [Deltaproteobacteria bacterium]|nr:glycosyltransferase [Deltaproteobacteria bacterium]
VRLLGIYRGIIFQASTVHEERDIRRMLGDDVAIFNAPDLVSSKSIAMKREEGKEKIPGYLKIIFLSRISRKKNLDGSLHMLKGVQGNLEFNIYGPVDDEEYWQQCRKIIDDIPENIRVRYHGDIQHGEVIETMSRHDLFFLPTHGENFGHVILEALVAGCPVLISDQTPWRDLAKKGVGWDLPLENLEEFTKVITECVEMDKISHEILSRNAREYGIQYCTRSDDVDKNFEMFNQALQRR